jgi:CheY-like chemotaxis protein
MALLLQEFTVIENAWALVVEDDAHDLLALTRLLQELHVQFKRNTTGKDVAQKARDMQPRPDVILLDMDLPDASTFDICDDIHSDEVLATIPVIAIGESKWASLENSLQACGFSGFICKPVPRKQFGQLLQDILNGKSVWLRDCQG